LEITGTPSLQEYRLLWSLKKCILHWFEQICLYVELADSNTHFQAKHKLTLLQNAVHPIPTLAVIKSSKKKFALDTTNKKVILVYCYYMLPQSSMDMGKCLPNHNEHYTMSNIPP
jgi:hypothetical protein